MTGAGAAMGAIPAMRIDFDWLRDKYGEYKVSPAEHYEEWMQEVKRNATGDYDQVRWRWLGELRDGIEWIDAILMYTPLGVGKTIGKGGVAIARMLLTEPSGRRIAAAGLRELQPMLLGPLNFAIMMRVLKAAEKSFGKLRTPPFKVGKKPTWGGTKPLYTTGKTAARRSEVAVKIAREIYRVEQTRKAIFASIRQNLEDAAIAMLRQGIKEIAEYAMRNMWKWIPNRRRRTYGSPRRRRSYARSYGYAPRYQSRYGANRRRSSGWM